MEKLTAPLRMAAHSDLSRFHQQESQQSVALLADVSQPSPIPTGFLRRNQPDVAGDLLGTVKPFWSSDDEFECQGGQWAYSGVRPQLSRYGSPLYDLLQLFASARESSA
jgi:hypothetical protein